MKSREISRSKFGPFSLACTDPYIGIGREYQSVTGFPNVSKCGVLAPLTTGSWNWSFNKVDLVD